MKETLLLLSGSQGILLSVALISSYFKSEYFKFFFGLVVFVISIEILGYWGLVSGYIQGNPYFQYWSLGSYLFLAPSVNYLLRCLSKSHSEPSKTDFLWLIPGALDVCIKLSRFYLSKFFNIQLFADENLFWILFAEILPIVWLLVVLVKSFNKNPIHKNYFLIFGAISLLLVLWVIDYTFPNRIFDFVEGLLICVLFLLGYLAYFYPKLFSTPKVIIDLDEKFSGYNHKSSLELFDKLLKEEGLYKRQDLSLSALSKEMDLPSKYVSYLINKYHRTNFKSFVNKLRVQEVIEKIKAGEQEKKTLLGIALEAGFSSKSSFNYTFKNVTGKTPSEYFQKDNSFKK